ncbi:MAG: AAA family ATPase [Nanohaloarchaea archaeon]|nr:AAA family ATPase [Candidatus Nanohaloarchaea archaeon]
MAVKMNRVSMGVPGVDGLIDGGVPESSVVLLCGGPGCGKTTFSCQYLMEGLRKGENGLYITLEESPEDIKKDALMHGWDFNKYESTGAFRIMFYDPFELKEIITRLKDLIVVNKIKRLVIDSVTLFGLYIKEEYNVRKELYRLIAALKETGCTAVLLSEISSGDTKKVSRYGVEEFVTDGVIVLHYMGIGEGVFRNIEVRKMRRTNHKNGLFPLILDDKGLHVDSDMAGF